MKASGKTREWTRICRRSGTRVSPLFRHKGNKKVGRHAPPKVALVNKVILRNVEPLIHEDGGGAELCAHRSAPPLPTEISGSSFLRMTFLEWVAFRRSPVVTFSPPSWTAPCPSNRCGHILRRLPARSAAQYRLSASFFQYLAGCLPDASPRRPSYPRA